MPAGVANGITILEPERSHIVVALAAGESVRAIAKRLKHHWHTVNAVKAAEWHRVEARKPIIASQHELAATVALDIINDKLLNDDRDDFSLTELNVIAGTSTDKFLALRGDSVSTVRHIHSLDLDEGDLLAFALQRSKTAQAHAVEQPPLLDALVHSPAVPLNSTAPTLSLAPPAVPIKGNAAHRRIASAKPRTVKGEADPNAPRAE